MLIRRRLIDAYDKDIWDAGRKVVSAIWDALGWIWHGESQLVIFGTTIIIVILFC